MGLDQDAGDEGVVRTINAALCHLAQARTQYRFATRRSPLASNPLLHTSYGAPQFRRQCLEELSIAFCSTGEALLEVAREAREAGDTESREKALDSFAGMIERLHRNIEILNPGAAARLGRQP